MPSCIMSNQYYPPVMSDRGQETTYEMVHEKDPSAPPSYEDTLQHPEASPVPVWDNFTDPKSGQPYWKCRQTENVRWGSDNPNISTGTGHPHFQAPVPMAYPAPMPGPHGCPQQQQDHCQVQQLQAYPGTQTLYVPPQPQVMFVQTHQQPGQLPLSDTQQNLSLGLTRTGGTHPLPPNNTCCSACKCFGCCFP